MVRVVLVLLALHGAARPLQHAIFHEEAHHGEGLNGPVLHAQCLDCELDKVPLKSLVLPRLAMEKGFPMDRSPSLSGGLMGDQVRGTMGRAPPSVLS